MAGSGAGHDEEGWAQLVGYGKNGNPTGTVQGRGDVLISEFLVLA